MTEYAHTKTTYRPTSAKLFEAQLAVVQRLKGRFQNLTAEEASQLASTICLELEGIWFGVQS